MKSRKGQGLSINIIIVAALALIVLVTLVVIFTQDTDDFPSPAEATEPAKMKVYLSSDGNYTSFIPNFISEAKANGESMILCPGKREAIYKVKIDGGPPSFNLGTKSEVLMDCWNRVEIMEAESQDSDGGGRTNRIFHIMTMGYYLNKWSGPEDYFACIEGKNYQKCIHHYDGGKMTETICTEEKELNVCPKSASLLVRFYNEN